jgi:hypothetical protein
MKREAGHLAICQEVPGFKAMFMVKILRPADLNFCTTRTFPSKVNPSFPPSQGSDNANRNVMPSVNPEIRIPYVQ